MWNVDRARGGEVPHAGGVGPLRRVERVDGLGDDEVQIGEALPVGVAHRVDRRAVDEEGDVGPVVQVEAAQEVLLRLAAAGVLHGEEPGDRLEHALRAEARAEAELRLPRRRLGGGEVLLRGAVAVDVDVNRVERSPVSPSVGARDRPCIGVLRPRRSRAEEEDDRHHRREERAEDGPPGGRETRHHDRDVLGEVLRLVKHDSYKACSLRGCLLPLPVPDDLFDAYLRRLFHPVPRALAEDCPVVEHARSPASRARRSGPPA